MYVKYSAMGPPRESYRVGVSRALKRRERSPQEQVTQRASLCRTCSRDQRMRRVRRVARDRGREWRLDKEKSMGTGCSTGEVFPRLAGTAQVCNL